MDTISKSIHPSLIMHHQNKIVSPGLPRLGIAYHIQSLPHPQRPPFAAISSCVLLTPTTSKQQDYNVIFYALCGFCDITLTIISVHYLMQ